MGVSHIYADFPSGKITERIVNMLSALPIAKFAALVESGLIKASKDEEDTILQTLSYQNLRWNLIDDYAQACGVSLKDIIYGEEFPAQTYYSYFDREAIALLNTLPVLDLSAFIQVIQATFSNPGFQISMTDAPSAKIMAFGKIGDSLPDFVPEEELSLYSMNINDEMTRLRKKSKRARFVFHIDYILDMCRYYHISPHWVFSLKGPLLCNTPEADAAFDCFCLLSKTQQLYALEMLITLNQQSAQPLPEQDVQQLRQLIQTEGGHI